MEHIQPTIVFYGTGIDRGAGARQPAECTLVKELREIIFNKDSNKLEEFYKAHPEITLYNGYGSECVCGCGMYTTSIDLIVQSQTCTESLEHSPFVLGEKFIDSLFELGYITDKDIYIISKMLSGMADYEKWDDVIYLIKKMDPIALKSYCSEQDDPTKEVEYREFYSDFTNKMNHYYINKKYYTSIGNYFYDGYATHYYGKIYGKALEFFKILKACDIPLRDDETGEEIPHSSKTDFWDIEKDIIDAINHENFKERDIEYWDSLPETSVGIV